MIEGRNVPAEVPSARVSGDTAQVGTMNSRFVSKLKPVFDAICEQMDLYVPKRTGPGFVYRRYEPGASVDYNEVRVCTPAKEFLFPLRELAAVFPEPVEPEGVRPFAVFGLKSCDLRSLDLLDKVFLDEEYRDEAYAARREAMFIISSDCGEPAESCFCSAMGGEPFATDGFDLNIAHLKDGFILEAGSQRGKSFISGHAQLFADVPDSLLSERQQNREAAKERLEAINKEYELDRTVGEVVGGSEESEVFEEEAATCVECQACTRVCPTCHCFYLYDTRKEDYFGKMRMWDSCMRTAYAEVAGGANPRRALGERLRHRLMHKFAYFLERYGVDMCVGCGRCVDAEAGDVDIRVVLKRLNDELGKKGRSKRQTPV